jgi:hypothetical protein
VTITASPVEVAQAYEALRAQALGQAPAVTPRGLALFLRVGLAGWMPACAPRAPAAPAARSSAGRPRTPPVELTAELVRVLTEMALGGHRRCGA